MDLDATIADPRAKLLELGRAVARAATIEDVIRVLADVAGPLVSAANATALLLDETHCKLVVYHGPAARTAAVRVVDLSDPTPAAEAVRTGQPVFVASLEELCELYPRFVQQLERVDWAALAVLPMYEGGELFGVVVYRWMESGRVHGGTPGADRDDLRARRSCTGTGAQPRSPASPTRVGCASPTVISTASPPPSPTISASRCASSARTSTCCSTTSTPTSSTKRRPHYAERIRLAVGRADRLIVALLDYGRAGGKPMADEEVALGAVARDVLEALRARLDEWRS